MSRWIISKTSRLKILKIGFSWVKDFRKMNSTGSIECIHALLERNQFSHLVSLVRGSLVLKVFLATFSRNVDDIHTFRLYISKS